jgi:hypothetical protein
MLPYLLSAETVAWASQIAVFRQNASFIADRCQFAPANFAELIGILSV